MASVQDAVGKLGESIAEFLLSRRFERPKPYFNPVFLGDKHNGIDLYVEVLLPGFGITPYFFAQVKTTSKGYLVNGKLRASVTKPSTQALRQYPAPTYVIGVDERALTPTAFLTAVVDTGPDRLSAIPTTHRLEDELTLEVLHAEVRRYWESQGGGFSHSRFAP